MPESICQEKEPVSLSLDNLMDELKDLMNPAKLQELTSPTHTLDFRSVLKNLRENKGHDIGKVAESTGLSCTYVCALERIEGKEPSLSELHKLAQFYQLKASEIMEMAEMA